MCRVLTKKCEGWQPHVLGQCVVRDAFNCVKGITLMCSGTLL